MRRALLSLTLALAAGLVAGCASVMRIDSDVTSFPQWPAQAPQAGDRFAFERLPSQQGSRPPSGQDMLERAVGDALLAWGLRLPQGEEPVRWLVQVGAQGQRLPRAPWDPDPWSGWRISGGFSGRHGGVALGFPLLPMDSPYYVREIAIVVREAATGRVAYETRARHDGRWNDSPALWAAMAQAALRDFPQPPAGTRRVDIDIPR